MDYPMKKIVKTLALLLFFGTMALAQQGCGPTSDSFGKDHPIPEGMTYEIPLPENAPAPAVDSLSDDSYLQLWNGIQGGIYQYWFSFSILGNHNFIIVKHSA